MVVVGHKSNGLGTRLGNINEKWCNFDQINYPLKHSVEMSKFCEKNGDIEFAFYLVEEAQKLTGQEKQLRKRLTFLERKLAEHLSISKGSGH